MRTAIANVAYNGKNITQELQDYTTEFTFVDAPSGELDDITLRVADRDRKWLKSWKPVEGDKIKVDIVVENWYKEGDKKKLPCGTFHVDGLSFSGPPDTTEIKAASFPVSSDVRQEKRTKVWEKVKLSTIAQDVAKRANLKLVREVPTDPTYSRIEQQDQTDFAFLMDLAKQEGFAIKVTDGKLVMFDEAKFEKGESVATFEHGSDRIIRYNFDWSSANCAYRACELTYDSTEKPSKKKKDSGGGIFEPETIKATGIFDPGDDGGSPGKKKKGKKKTIKASNKVTYVPPGAPKTGPVLRIKESADSKADALRVAKNRLREKNKLANRADITVVGDVRIFSGSVITLKGFGHFDGNYIVERPTHAIGPSGYETRMEIRKILGW